MTIFLLRYNTTFTDSYVVNTWFGKKDRQPSDEVVHSQTLRYIHKDYIENGAKYSQKDRIRIRNLLLKEGCLPTSQS